MFTANQGFKPLAERMMCLKARLLRCFLVARVNAGGTDGQSRVVVEVVICAERGTELRNVLHSKWIIMEALFLTICYYLYTFYVWLREGNFFCLKHQSTVLTMSQDVAPNFAAFLCYHFHQGY